MADDRFNSSEGGRTRADDRLLPVKTEAAFLVNFVRTVRVGIPSLAVTDSMLLYWRGMDLSRDTCYRCPTARFDQEENNHPSVASRELFLLFVAGTNISFVKPDL
jgi:hypothetical protein